MSVSSSPFIVVVLTGDQERTERIREEVRGVRGKEDGNTKEIERGAFGFEVMFGESDSNHDRRDDGGWRRGWGKRGLYDGSGSGPSQTQAAKRGNQNPSVIAIGHGSPAQRRVAFRLHIGVMGRPDGRLYGLLTPRAPTNLPHDHVIS